jgi:hypothetical protein
MTRAALFVVAALVAAPPALADWLVTRDGGRIETRGRWKVTGDRVRFVVHDRVRREMRTLSLPLSEIDLARSEAETAETASRRARGPVSSGAFLQAWDDWVLEGLRSPRSAELRLNLGGERWENLLQAPAGSPQEDLSAVRSDARVTLRLLPRTPLKAYAEVGQARYGARPSALAYGVGLGFDGPRHAVQLMTRLDRNRPAADLGDVADADNDVVNLRLRWALRTRRFEWWLGGDRSEQRFTEAPSRDSRQHGVQTGILFRAFGGRLAPELGLGWAQLEGALESEDYGQARLTLGLRYSPARSATLTTRFENTLRSYATVDPRARNFGREDVRRRWSLGAQFRVTRHTAWTVLYDRFSGDSSRPGRAFTASNLGTSVTVKLGSTAGPPDRPVPGLRPRAHSPASPARPATPELADEAPPPRPEAEPVERVALVHRAQGGLARIESFRRGAETETTIEVRGRWRYSSVELAGPARFVVDLEGVNADAGFAVNVGTAIVSRIRVGPFRPGPSPVARVVFDLEAPAVAHVEREGSSLRVVLQPVVATAAVDAPR